MLECDDLRLELRSFHHCDSTGNDWPRNIAGTAKGLLRADEDVGDVLVFAEEGKVEKNLEGLSVGGQNHELGDTTVQGLGGWEGEHVVSRGKNKLSLAPFRSCL